jgi:hypothetical protein
MDKEPEQNVSPETEPRTILAVQTATLMLVQWLIETAISQVNSPPMAEQLNPQGSTSEEIEYP